MARQPKPGEWEYVVGEVPHLLTAYERAERGNAIYTRLWDGKRYREKNKRLHDGIRDAKGKIDPKLEVEAQQAAIRRQAEAATPAEPVEDKGPLTLAAGFKRYLHPKDGKYPSDTAWKRCVVTYSKIITRILGGGTHWSSIKHSHYRKLWRTLAQEYNEKDEHGIRNAEKIVGVLQSATTWLHQEELLETGAGLPARKWRDALRAEWAEITKTPIAKPKRPRYTVAEQERLWAALPKADPRLALAVEIGAELRLGQVVRVKRSHIEPHAGHEIGAVQVYGSGKKRGTLVVLTPAQQSAIVQAMQSGYLSELEAAYRKGKLKDYHLITGGRTKQGKAQIKHADSCLHERTLAALWEELEQLAGVEWIKGRKWYGLRRLHADLAEDVEDDARVNNAMGGWTNTTTRELYQQQGRPEIVERAAVVRAKIRPKNPSDFPQIVSPAPKSGETESENNGAS